MTFKYIFYTARIWLLSLCLSPIILGLSILIEGDYGDFPSVGQLIGSYLLFTLFPAVLSLPAYGLFMLTNELAFQSSDNIFVGKVIASFLGLVIVYLLFEIFLGKILDYGSIADGREALSIIIVYSFTILFGIWYYEPFPKT